MTESTLDIKPGTCLLAVSKHHNQALSPVSNQLNQIKFILPQILQPQITSRRNNSHHEIHLNSCTDSSARHWRVG